jgi:hypothetical protein
MIIPGQLDVLLLNLHRRGTVLVLIEGILIYGR